jgi:hypothetical protein
MINLKSHNIMDYVIAMVLVLSPFVFGFAEIDAARNTFLVLGFGLAGYSLITKYFYSIAKIIPLGVHMVFDVLAGVVIILAPYLFNYNWALTTGQNAWHWIMGIGAMALVGVTRTRTEADKTPEERRLTVSTGNLTGTRTHAH